MQHLEQKTRRQRVMAQVELGLHCKIPLCGNACLVCSFLTNRNFGPDNCIVFWVFEVEKEVLLLVGIAAFSEVANQMRSEVC
ncbi:hypothetical protein AC579_2878 [Pseudocercospora musae]|uniref:Uncharacterized protein n=1 Tax=Pseudocercospora musae TaxID=113226 RepID=A0A139IU10_9PEZI|nr:hypothetical protein AC579_2878 [Pseudocercospora musae]